MKGVGGTDRDIDYAGEFVESIIVGVDLIKLAFDALFDPVGAGELDGVGRL